MRAGVHACVRACMRACVRVCVRACMCQYRCVPDSTLLPRSRREVLLYCYDRQSYCVTMYTVTVSYVCAVYIYIYKYVLLDEDTPIAYQKNYQCRGLLDHNLYMLIRMDVFILFVDDHRIALDEIYKEFS